MFASGVQHPNPNLIALDIKIFAQHQLSITNICQHNYMHTTVDIVIPQMFPNLESK